MATTGGAGGDSSVAGVGVGVGIEFYRVLVTGIPTPNKEVYKMKRLDTIIMHCMSFCVL